MDQTGSEAGGQNSTPLYFSVSCRKLAVLSIGSLGAYEIYWFYRNWAFVKQRTRQDIRPYGRAAFAVVFCYDLFEDVAHAALIRGVPETIRPGLLALAYISLTLAWRLPHPFHLISLLNFLPLLPVQKLTDQINLLVAPHAERNDHFSKGNIAVIILGGLVLIWVIIAPFVRG